MKQHSKPLQLCNIALIALFLFYYAGATLFPHTHEVNGVKVIHSHPHTSSSGHTHSSSAFQTIDLLTALCFIIATAAIALTLLSASKITFFQQKENTHSLPLSTITLRGPPSC